MRTFNKTTVVLIVAIFAGLCLGTAQADILLSEDFEGTLDADPTIGDFGFTTNDLNILTTAVPVGATSGLAGGSANQAALKPGGSVAYWIRPVAPTFFGNTVRLTFDMDVPDAYAGEGYVGLNTGSCCNESGIFVGLTGTGWNLDLQGLAGGQNMFITESEGIASAGTTLGVSVQVDITDTGGTIGFGEIKVDLFNEGTTTSLPGTSQYVYNLNATQRALLPTLDNVAMGFAGATGINEIDNIVVDQGPPFGIPGIPEPTSLALAVMGLIGFVTLSRRRKR